MHCRRLTRAPPAAARSSDGYIDKKNDRRMDDCLRYALVSGKKALEDAGIGMGSDAFNALDKQRCALPAWRAVRCVLNCACARLRSR